MSGPGLYGTQDIGGDPMTDSADDSAQVAGRSPLRIAFDRLRRDKIAVVSAAVVLLFFLIAIFAPLITAAFGVDPDTRYNRLLEFDGYPAVGASLDHPFGIEPTNGRDLFARWVYGARYSVLIAVTAASVATFLGIVVGLVAGFFGGWVDRVLSFVIDVFLSLPFLLIAIAVAPIVAAQFASQGLDVFGRAQLIVLILILSVFGWMGLARLIRGEVLSLREREFILAARAIGAPTHRILFRELLPNLVAPIVISISLGIPAYVTAEAGLSLLGVGLVEQPSWGRTISAAINWFGIVNGYLLAPVLGVLALVLALNLLGDSVRDALDPKTRR
ncbi:MAG: ABC transporter permease [Actinomycetota bacterium]|nr:ABC transporter permease [Actinomycetota bacterium]